MEYFILTFHEGRSFLSHIEQGTSLAVDGTRTLWWASSSTNTSPLIRKRHERNATGFGEP